MPIPYRPVTDRKQLIQEAITTQKRIDARYADNKQVEINVDGTIIRARTEAANKIARTKRVPAKYASFTESLRTVMVEHMLYHIYEEVIKGAQKTIGRQLINEATMHSMCYSFISDNEGPSSLISKMTGYNRNASYFIEGMVDIYKKHFKSILEGVDRDDAESFVVPSEKMKEFKDDIDNHCAECNVVTDAIADRVADSIVTFIKDEAEDRAKIEEALASTKEKVDSLKTDDEQLKESYARLGRRLVNDIRNKPKSLYGEMVNTMAHSVMGSKTLQTEFMTEDNHIDVGKVIDKTALMYGFLETVNSMNMVKVDSNYINEVLNSLRDISE